MTNFEENYINSIKEVDGLTVAIMVILIDEDNHPLGRMGAMMMGQNYKSSCAAARKSFNMFEPNGTDSRILIQGKIQVSKDKIKLTNPGISDVTIFRPAPPMVIDGQDISYWWSYNDLKKDEGNSFPIRTFQVVVKNANENGFTTFPVHN